MTGDRPVVLVVVSQLDLGGTETHLYRVLPLLQQAGVDPRVYVLKPDGYYVDRLRRAGIPVIQPPACFGKHLVHLYNFPAIVRLLYSQQADIVHFFLPGAYLIGGLASLLRTPLIRIMSRRSLNLYQQKHPLAAVLERWLHKRMDAISGNSQAVLEQLSRQEGVPPHKLALIYNGIGVPERLEHGARAALRHKLGLETGSTVLVMVANLIPYKGHAVLLAALAALDKETGQDWVLLCAGRDDGMAGGLNEYARVQQIEAKVRFLGPRDDIMPLLQAADIAILSSLQEGFSNFILEAMAAGLPVVATDVGGNREAVIDGETGLLVPPSDPARLASAIRSLLENPSLARSMGEKGRERVINDGYSLQDCVRRYCRLYRRVIARQSVAEPDGAEGK